jgi:hypothetical protein
MISGDYIGRRVGSCQHFDREELLFSCFSVWMLRSHMTVVRLGIGALRECVLTCMEISKRCSSRSRSRLRAAGILLSLVWAGCGVGQTNMRVQPIGELSALLGDASGRADAPAITIDHSGYPVVAWSQKNSGSPAIYLVRWNGTSWVDLQGSGNGRGVSNTEGSALAPSVAVDAMDHPVVAWQDSSTVSWEIYVRRWDGSAWQELQQSATEGGVSRTPLGLSAAASMALDDRGNPVIAWEESFGNNSDVYTRRYDCGWRGCSWEDVGGKPGQHGGMGGKVGRSAFPALVLDHKGRPIVAWQDSLGGSFQIYLRRFTGSRWEEIGNSATAGGISHSQGEAIAASLALDSAEQPIVAWQDQRGGKDRIFLAHWNGKQWEGWAGSDSGDGLSTGLSGGGSLPSIILTEGRATVAFQSQVAGQTRIFIRRWDGRAWQPWPGTDDGLVKQAGANASAVRLAASAAGGICLTWRESIGKVQRIAVQCLR